MILEKIDEVGPDIELDLIEVNWKDDRLGRMDEIGPDYK